MLETKLIQTESGEKYVNGYFLTLDQIQKLIVDYVSETSSERVGNDKLYILNWINQNKL